MGLLQACMPQLICGNTFATFATYRANKSANVFGEVVLSFVSVASIKMDLQPMDSQVQRYVHGQLEPIKWTGFVAGSPDVQEFDRARDPQGKLIEVADINRYGDHIEIYWRYVR